jgi:hypothetical protein
MIGILGQHSLKVPPAEDDQPVETLTADAPHPAFGITVRNRNLDRRANDSHTVGGKDVLDRERELLVVVADQKPDRHLKVLQPPGQVADLLADPGLVGIVGYPKAKDPPPTQLYEEKDV